MSDKKYDMKSFSNIYNVTYKPTVLHHDIFIQITQSHHKFHKHTTKDSHAHFALKHKPQFHIESNKDWIILNDYHKINNTKNLGKITIPANTTSGTTFTFDYDILIKDLLQFDKKIIDEFINNPTDYTAVPQWDTDSLNSEYKQN